MDEVTPEAPEAPEAAPATEGGPVSAPVESGEFEIAALPQGAQDYIRELREEARDGRKAHEPYKNAFSAFNEAEQEYLLNMVTTVGVDQDAGAQIMHDLSTKMLGIEKEAEATVEDPVVTEAAEEAGMTREELTATVRAEMQQEQMFAAIEAETRAVGFDPGSKEAGELWDMAVALDELDLAKLAPLYRQAKGLDPQEPEAEKEVLQAEDINPSTAEFPATAAATGGGTGDSNAGEQQTIHKIGSPELRAQVLRRIEESNTPGQ